MMQYSHSKGFTLAELMAVIIILALLSALSIGYYKRSIEQSRFSEGLMAASAVAEAQNRAYFDEQLEMKTPSKRHKLNVLDIGISRKKNCVTASDYCVATKYFEVQTDANGVTTAYRGTVASYKYQIEIQPHFASSNKDRIACVGASSSGINFDAATFCESLGYTEKSGNYYTKK